MKKQKQIYYPKYTQCKKSFSVMSYNVLADAYCDQKYFPYARPQELHFASRFPKVLNQIIQLSPDIGCLQEVDNYANYEIALSNLGYSCIFAKRPQRTDGCLIIFRTKVFRCLNQISKSLDQCAREEKLDQNYMRQNVYQILTLEHMESKHQIVIGNIHMYWNPREEDVKYFQLLTFLNNLQQIIQPEQHAIFCGDFNSQPNTNALHYITNKLKPNRDRMHSPHEQRFNQMAKFYQTFEETKIEWKSAYDPYPKYTNYTEKFSGCIDYIFYKNAGCHVSKTLQLPDEEFITNETALPNSIFPSDHLPIQAEFDLYSL